MDFDAVFTLMLAGLFIFGLVFGLIRKASGQLPDTEETERIKREATEGMAIMAILGSLTKRK
jgi:hypothetical protein